jgi:hypothetical protein
VRAHAGVDDAQLGLALLCVGAGALASMRATTLAYLGFLVGPPAVGLAADAATLRWALGGVGGLALVLAVAVRAAPAPSRSVPTGA